MYLLHLSKTMDRILWTVKKQYLAMTLLGLSVLSVLLLSAIQSDGVSQPMDNSSEDDIVPAARVQSPFVYDFHEGRIIKEATSIDRSKDPYWWLNSGGEVIIQGGAGKTIQGELSNLSEWRFTYSLSNPRDTDNGSHPQNIFRLITRSTWGNFEQQVYAKINAVNLSESAERDMWDGILLIHRYQDQDNLYYAGIRVDGNVVIKKKVKGVYYTMALDPVFGGATYNRTGSPNLIPEHQWIGVKTTIKTNPIGTVSLQVFLDENRTGEWKLVSTATDDGFSYQGKAFTEEGYAGIRTDFMDAEFDDFKIESIL